MYKFGGCIFYKPKCLHILTFVNVYHKSHAMLSYFEYDMWHRWGDVWYEVNRNTLIKNMVLRTCMIRNCFILEIFKSSDLLVNYQYIKKLYSSFVIGWYGYIYISSCHSNSWIKLFIIKEVIFFQIKWYA